jgi:GNAT superfamily N-acetyltransferase
MVRYECTPQSFRPGVRLPGVRYAVRWLNWDRDFSLAQAMWPEAFPLTRATWDEARALGHRYCGAIEQGRIRAIAAVWRYSETAWEAAAVRTLPEARRQGYAQAVISFVTAHILDAGKWATCTTGEENVAMQRTAESVGFYRIDSRSVSSQSLGPGRPRDGDWSELPPPIEKVHPSRRSRRSR